MSPSPGAEQQDAQRNAGLAESPMNQVARLAATLAAALTLTFLPGCARPRYAAVPADSLGLARSVLLRESDSQYITHPFRWAIQPDGDYLISDDGMSVVWWYRADGTLRRIIGRRGGGPGEFKFPGAIIRLDDSTIAVDERREQRFKVLRLRDGVELRAVRSDAMVPFNGILWHDTVWFGSMAIRRGTDPGIIAGVGSLVRWPIRDSVATAQWSAPRGLESQGSLSPLGWLATQMLAVDSAGFWVKYGLRDVLERHARDGRLEGEWQIPAVRRRGVPSTKVAFALDRANWSSHELSDPHWTELTFSQDAGFGLLPDRLIALVTKDAMIEGNVTLGRYFVSLLDPLRHRACLDMALPNSAVAVPLIALRGDSIVVLGQEVDAANQVRLMVRYYTLPVRTCRWQSMPPLTPSGPDSPSKQ